jgi:hypothetical protein
MPTGAYRCGLTILAVMAATGLLFSWQVSSANGEPALGGTYTSSKQHPRVFMTPESISDLVKRINSPGSFSQQQFAKLAAEVKAELTANVDWDAAYSGCSLVAYLNAFSYEPTLGRASQLAAQMKLKEGMQPPAGAAIVASRLALYAVLAKAGAHTAPASPSAGEAAALAKRILLAWAQAGFRQRDGSFLQSPTQFCEADGTVSHNVEASVGLQIGRGVIYSVQAQDLLESIKAFNIAQTNQVNDFHKAMFRLLEEATNFRAGMKEMNGPEVCERYSNHVGAHLVGLLSIARLFDDPQKFNAVLYGNDRSIPIAIPWTSWFNHAVYGVDDKPIGCHRNTGPNSLTSHPFFQTNIVAAGEILDRYRNENPAHAFGYSLGVLAGLFDMADIMENAGYDAYRYRGAHKQSIETATQYYSCYGKTPGFKKMVTDDNARTCPDYQQYVGQIVNGLEIDVVMGTYRFPGNSAITEVEPMAKAKAGHDLLDPIRFGRWNN